MNFIFSLMSLSQRSNCMVSTILFCFRILALFFPFFHTHTNNSHAHFHACIFILKHTYTNVIVGCTTKLVWRVISMEPASEDDVSKKGMFPRKSPLPPQAGKVASSLHLTDAAMRYGEDLLYISIECSTHNLILLTLT